MAKYIKCPRCLKDDEGAKDMRLQNSYPMQSLEVNTVPPYYLPDKYGNLKNYEKPYIPVDSEDVSSIFRT